MTDHSGTAAPTDGRVAIVGMAGRFPGARNSDELWDLVRNGREAVCNLSEADLIGAGVPRALFAKPNYVRAAAPLDDMEMFDPGFFGLSPREAAMMDPQHRHFLECAWEALEHAGYTPESFPGSIGVFGGCGMQAYFAFNLLNNPELMASAGLFLVRHTGNDKDFLTTRVSYHLNLRGPSIGVQTACSTSLVAVHMACQSLLNGECDMALAGGATIEIPHRQGYLYEEGEILSPDGHCRAFDADSQGTVFGSGAGIVVLRRLEDAIAARDHVHAVIIGSAVNNDGSGKVGYLAPSVDGQAAAIAEAIGVAGIDPASVTYVETHGTGTPVGDPIEIAALTEAFRRGTDRRGFCAIGSIKTNIGHLDTAAGVASLIKAAKAVEAGELPPSLHFATPNPAIPFAETPFVVNAALRAWTTEGPRRAGVNSLGVGGTNAHVILEEAPAPKPREAVAEGPALLVVSARSEAALERACNRLATHLAPIPDADLPDAAWTLQVGRRPFKHRRALVASTSAEAVVKLRGVDRTRTVTQVAPDRSPGVAMLFPGGGAQYPGMGRGLYHREPAYRAAVDECLAWCRRSGLDDLTPLMLPPSVTAAAAAAAALERPLLSTLSVFITEVALARLFESWGVTPAAMIGHSLGEYAAAHLAGVFSLEDALALVEARGRIFERLPPGAMLSVDLPEEELAPLLPDGVVIAVVNGPDSAVASGTVDGIARAEALLQDRGVTSQRVHIAVAAHSPMLDAHLDEFRRFVRTIAMRAPSVPFVSNLTGNWIASDVATSPDYWVRHLRETVRFADGLKTLMADDTRVLLEVGPGQVLGMLARSTAGPRANRVIAASMRHPKEEVDDLAVAYGAVGQLWAAGVQIDWTGVQSGADRRRVALPTYPFERERHWIDAAPRATPEAAVAPAPSQPDRLPFAEWFREPRWRPAPVASTRPRPIDRVWVFAPEPAGPGGSAAADLATALVGDFAREGAAVTIVRPGDRFAQLAEREYIVRPGAHEDLEALVGGLGDSLPAAIVHAWTLEAPGLETGFYSLMALGQALGALDPTDPIAIEILTRGLAPVGGHAPADPLVATVLGPARTMPREYAGLRTRVIDLDPSASHLADEVGAVAREIRTVQTAPWVALRGRDRWVQGFEAVTKPDVPASASFVQPGAVYLITGGFGALGGAIAAQAAAEGANLALLARGPLDPARVEAVRALERAGADVWCGQADLDDPRAVMSAVEAARARFGRLDGIFHCAGMIDDAPMALKTAAQAAAVLSPKVAGTLALDRAAGDVPLFVLFSSTSSFLGLPGQVDYTAANEFLNAFARWRSARRPGRTVAVAWGAWRDIGIASRALQPRATGPAHPILGGVTIRTAARVEHAATLEADGTWELAEHRLTAGPAVLPGTAYAERLLAAAIDAGIGAPEIADLVFLEPMTFRHGERRVVRTTLERDGDGWQGVVTSTSSDGEVPAEHARATVRPAPRLAAAFLAVDQLRARCSDVARIFTAEGINRLQARHLAFGPRWASLKAARYGRGEAVATLTLPEAYHGDLAAHPLHAALLDIATSVGLPLVEGYESSAELFVPFSYGSLRCHAPLPAQVTVHARLRRPASAGREAVSFDVTIANDAGRVIVEVEDFVLRQVSPDALATLTSASTPGKPVSANARQRSWVERGIRPAEGLAALARVVSLGMGPEIVVSPIGPEALLAAVDAEMPAARAVGAGASSGLPDGLDDVERAVAEMWQELLGVETVARADNFFAMGGHSLIAVRLISRIERRFKSGLRVSAIFDAPTFDQLTALVKARVGPSAEARPAADAPAGEPALGRIQRSRFRTSIAALDAASEDEDQ